MKPAIFVVDDDPAMARLLRYTLEAEGFAVRIFSTADSILNLAPDMKPALFLLDMVLPDKSGLDLCSEIRQSPHWGQTPVIFVTGKTSEMDRVAGLQLADDYIAKPFSPLELVARVQAVLRRTDKQQSPSRLTIGDLELDGESMTVQVRGQMVSVTAMEFRLLAHLALNIGKTFRRDQLLDAVWDARFVTPRTVDVHVRRLREKIEPQPEAPRYLQTVRGKGYRLVSQDVPANGSGAPSRLGVAGVAPVYPASIAV
ncbi:MAG: response regulator transcription factor [Candidatus Sulfotelmatobacter sp.]